MCTGAIHILYLFPRIRQPLDGNFAVSGKKFRLPAVAGEEQDLPVPSGLLQKPQGGGAAPVVEIGQGVVSTMGTCFSGGSTRSQMASRTARYSWSSVPAESSAASRNTGSPAGSAERRKLRSSTTPL